MAGAVIDLTAAVPLVIVGAGPAALAVVARLQCRRAADVLGARAPAPRNGRGRALPTRLSPLRQRGRACPPRAVVARWPRLQRLA